MNIEVIKSRKGDNFFYLISDAGGTAALVDPIDGEQAVERVRSAGVELKYVLNTHFHPDHVGGNPAVLQAFPEAQVIAGAGDAAMINAQFRGPNQRGVDLEVAQGDRVQVGALDLQVLETPGHTPGHISFLCEGNLFSGDTIFVAGAGNCRFGGDPRILYETFRDVLRRLPEETTFYAGHDYSIRNAEFLLSLEPEHPETQAVLDEAKQARDAGQMMVTTLGRERSYNAFLRFDDKGVRQRLEELHGELFEEARRASQSQEEAVFRCLRLLRDQW